MATKNKVEFKPVTVGSFTYKTNRGVARTVDVTVNEEGELIFRAGNGNRVRVESVDTWVQPEPTPEPIRDSSKPSNFSLMQSFLQGEGKSIRLFKLGAMKKILANRFPENVGKNGEFKIQNRDWAIPQKRKNGDVPAIMLKTDERAIFQNPFAKGKKEVRDMDSAKSFLNN